MKIGAPFSLPTTTSTTRRALLVRAGAAAAAAGAAGLAGCSLAGADHASYWSESGQLDVDYGAVMTTAREAGHTVDEPYYVGGKEARGIHPGGFPGLDRLGGFYLQARLPAGEELPEAELRSVFRRMFEDLDLPPDAVDGLTFEYSPSVW